MSEQRYISVTYTVQYLKTLKQDKSFFVALSSILFWQVRSPVCRLLANNNAAIVMHMIDVGKI